MILMGEVIEKLESMDERLRVDQRCRNIEQEWYENKQILSDMLRDASKNNFLELLVTSIYFLYYSFYFFFIF